MGSYKTIGKPSWNPPDYVVGPAWTTLYLMMAIAATTAEFVRCAKMAGWLLVPHLAWVSFASVLNFAIWRMNV